MGFKCGIVGLPNVGKSTFFNALTKAGVAAANYPFCTIEPNVGIVPVPDERLSQIAKLVGSKEIIPAAMRFVDIAGLIAGAAEGNGLGNAFLGHVRETQAIAHVVRCFDHDDVIHVSGHVDPIADIEVIHTELGLADLASVEKALQKNEKELRKGGKEALLKQSLLEMIRGHLNEGTMLRQVDLSDEAHALVSELQLITAKPMFYVANVDESGLAGNDYVREVMRYADKEGMRVIPICAAIESEIATLDGPEQREFLESLGLESSGLNRVIRSGYELLGLQTYFTAGPKETRAWTIEQGFTAPSAAGVVHTDFEKGFIRAEVISFDDYVRYHGEIGAKEAGKWRLEGRDYVVQDGDVMLFRFNV